MTPKTRLPTTKTKEKRQPRQSHSELRLVFEANAPDKAALSEAIRGWIVPVLVKHYLLQRSQKTDQRTNVIPDPLVGSCGE